jgi:hypothetical protein
MGRCLPGANTCSYDRSVLYLRRCDTGPAAAWWAEVARYATAAPAIIRELLRGPSVVCDPVEAEQALAWARAHPAWVDEPAPLYVHDSMTR